MFHACKGQIAWCLCQLSALASLPQYFITLCMMKESKKKTFMVIGLSQSATCCIFHSGISEEQKRRQQPDFHWIIRNQTVSGAESCYSNHICKSVKCLGQQMQVSKSTTLEEATVAKSFALLRNAVNKPLYRKPSRLLKNGRDAACPMP